MDPVTGTRSGETFPLDPQAELGRGAEGVVYRARGGRAVKIFKTPLPAADADRLTALAALAKSVPGFAWPVEPVADAAGNLVGVVLPLAPGESYESQMDDRRTAAIPVLTRVGSPSRPPAPRPPPTPGPARPSSSGT